MARVAPKDARALVAVGGVVTVAALLVAGPVFGPTPFALLPLIVGALLVAAGAALAPSGSGVSLRKVAKWGAVLAPLAAGLSLSHFVKLEIDVTRAQVNTLADESVAAARAAQGPVRVVSFLEAGERAEVELRALVDRYARANPAITFEARSMKRAADVEVANALGVAALIALGGPNVVVVGAVPAGDDEEAPRVRLRVDGSGNLEEQLTNALAQVASRKTRARVYVTTGHGEPDVRDEGALGLSQLATFARARGVELVPLPFAVLQEHGVPDDARGLWILPVKSSMFLHEEPALRRAAQQVPTWIAVDVDAVAAVAVAAAGDVGVTVVNDVVVDEGGFGAVFGADTLTGSSQMAHPITRTLAGALTHFPRVATLALSPLEGTAAVPVVSSSAEAKAVVANARGPLPILVAAVTTAAPSGASGAPGAPGASGARRTLVSGDASFCQNAGIGLGANRDLALNALLWLVADDDVIAVRPRAKTGALLFLTPTARSRLTFVLVFLVPVVVAAFAAGSAARRRG